MIRHLRSKFLCHSYYVLFGMAGSGLLPPLMKSFEDAFGFSHARLGSLIGIASVVMAVAGLVAGRWYDRAGARAPFAACMLGCALGALGLFAARTAPAFVLALMAFQFANGLGAVVNPIVRHLYGEQSAGGINLLHGFQGAGRLLAPLMVAGCLAAGGDWRSALPVAAAFFAVWFGLVLGGIEDPAPARADASPARSGRTRALLRAPLVRLGLIGFVFLSAGEMGLICWIPNYLESEAGFPKTVALTTLTCMMAGTTATRLVLSRLRGPPRPAWLLAGGALLAAGYMLLTRTDAVLPLYGFGLLIGAAVGPHWPSLAAVVYAAAPRGHGALTGLFVLASTLGALLSMSAIGWFGDRFGLERALFAAVGSSCAFTGLYARLRQRAGSGPEPG